MSPFYANYGYHPRATLKILPDERQENPVAEAYINYVRRAHEELRRTLKRAQVRYKKEFDKNAAPAPEFRTGDLVYRDGHEASLLAARLVSPASWRASQRSHPLALPQGKVSRHCQHSCMSEATCLALVSEASNEGPSSRLTSPRLVCLVIHSVTYKYIAPGEMHPFRTLQ